MSAEYLDELMTRYGTDKNIWGYHPYYEEAMEKKRFDVRKVLEVGICGYRDIPNNVVGASLFVWRDYFPNAKIYGIDNDGRFIFNDQERIHTALCDAYNARQLADVMHGFGGEFDMIVDDAVHDPYPQLLLLNALSPRLKKGGRYFVEEACPYKMDLPPEQWFAAHIPATSGITAVHACITHKPEQLVICVK